MILILFVNSFQQSKKRERKKREDLENAENIQEKSKEINSCVKRCGVFMTYREKHTWDQSTDLTNSYLQVIMDLLHTKDEFMNGICWKEAISTFLLGLDDTEQVNRPPSCGRAHSTVTNWYRFGQYPALDKTTMQFYLMHCFYFRCS